MRHAGRGGSVARRIAGLAREGLAAVEAGVAAGRARTARTKLAAQKKVAWQHASPAFVPHSQQLEHALRRGSVQRMHLVLKRVLDGEHRPDVAPALLERCADAVLARLLAPDGARWADAADCLTRVAWRARRQRSDHALWAMVRAVACDLRGDGALRAQHLAAITARDRGLALRVLESPVVSREMIAELGRIVAASESRELAVASYCAAMQRHPHSEIPVPMSQALAAHQEAIASSLHRCHGADLRRSGAAIAHLHIARADDAGLEAALSRLAPLAARAQWPMGVLAGAVGRLVAADERAAARQLLQGVAAGDLEGFTRRLGECSGLAGRSLGAALVQDELAIRLCGHRQALHAGGHMGAPPAMLPMTALFVPRLRTRLDDRAVRESVERYFADMGELLCKMPAAAAAATGDVPAALIREASGWCFRLQSAEPLALAAWALRPSACQRRPAEDRRLLAALTQALRSFGMIQFVHQSCAAAAAHGEPGPSEQPLAATVAMHWRARYVDVVGGLDATRRALLAEYLRRGIQPTPGELVVLQSHLASCGHSGDAWRLAASILPLVAPTMARPQNPAHLAAQAYYEELLVGLARHEPRRMLQLLDYLLGHHGTASAEFRRRLVDQAVVAFLRHGHFAGAGFYRLERLFIRHVRRPWFATADLNCMRARLWALHMFLRRQNYVPRFRLHRKQLYVHRSCEFVLGQTATPSPAKVAKQGVDTSTAPVKSADIDTAIEIYLRSVPRTAALGERSTNWVLRHKTRMVHPGS
ncbi:hypothetical protein H4R21_000361 [Coemansia helicoidea]|uniref:Uncharacterized protein n=1 Tax=Coemansia helicoidea TaxID=1286919 RepID=A0ACC1LGG5_9FUNG|nr:hypothetical protein H4R21_000361 [Coemansia helicoidea]